MAEEKVKVRELAEQMGVPSRDMLRAMHGMKMAAKSTSGSVTLEEANKLRDYFAERKQATVERSVAQPDVIVRRRKKETAAPKAETQPIREPTPESSADMIAESLAQPEQTLKKNASEKKIEKPSRKTTPARDARVISRPGDKVVETAAVEVPEQPKIDTPKEVRPEKTLAQEIREK